MKSRRLIILGILGLVLAVGLSGCKITSTSPDPAQTVIMQPGEEKTFTLTSAGGPVVSNKWEYDGTGLGQDIYGFGPKASYTYAPKLMDIGPHTIECIVEDGYLRLDPGGQPHVYPELEFVPTTKTVVKWQVQVFGVSVSPVQTIVRPGEVQEYTAKAYPEGIYIYDWYLDGVLTNTGNLFAFVPTFAQYGTHTLTVKAAGAGYSYESNLEIQVPFATVGSDLFDEPGHLVQTADGGYAVTVTSYEGDIQVYKLAADGRLLWHTTLGGSGMDSEGGIIATADGGYIVAGTFASADIAGAANHGGSDAYLAKLDAQGAIVCQRLYGGSAYDGVVALAPTTDNGFIAVGVSNSIDIPSAPGNGDTDFYVIKIDANGAVQWQRLQNVGMGDTAISIRQSTDGGYIIAGGYWSNYANTYSITACLLKLDPAGSLQWSRAYISGVPTNFADVLETPEGGYLAAGFCTRVIPFKINPLAYDALVVKYDARGNQLWQKTYGSGVYDTFTNLLQAPDGNYIAIGYTDSSGFSGYPLDGYLVKLDSSGKPLLQENISQVSCPIPVEGGGYMALRNVTWPGAQYNDISLVKFGPF